MALTSTISNTLTDPDGNPVPYSQVTIALVTWGQTAFRIDDLSEITPVTQVVTNPSGVWSLALERQSNISVVNTYYLAQEIIPAITPTNLPVIGLRTTLFQVGAVNQTLQAAAVAQPLGGPISYLTQAAGDARYVQAPGSFSGSIVAINPALAGTAGVATTYSRGDHRHGVTNEALSTRINTSESTTSLTYVDLATAGPIVTATTGANAIIIFGALTGNNTAGQSTAMSVAISGATTLAASDAYNLQLVSPVGGNLFSMSSSALLTGLNPGVNTFTCKYRVSANTGSWANRSLIVFPLP